MTQNENLRQVAFMGLAALSGIAIALFTKKRATAAATYREQSGERKRQSNDDIMERDKKIFRAEVQRHW